MRLLELPIDVSPFLQKNTAVGERIYHHLMDNHGFIGPVFLKHVIAMGEAKLKAALNAHKATFENYYGYQFSGKERYWQLAMIYADWALR
jgi:hypothetical protein